jgi:dephospho-CoA kinase
MKLIGITGGIGMGKSACSDWLHNNGHRVVDSDVISRELTVGDASVIAEIRAAFGGEIFDENGLLDRPALAQRIFSDESSRRVLEGILHPRIRRAWTAEVQNWREQAAGCGFVVIPLLFETDAEEHFDSIICIACTSMTQISRLRSRNWDVGQVNARIASQMAVKEKMARSHHVIWTEGAMASTTEQLKMVLRRLG